MAGSIEFTPPYQDGWQDNEEGATPITADILNNSYDAFLLLLNTWIENTETSLVAIPDSLTDLDGDVQISSPSNGQVLKFNGSKWVNAAESGGGSTVSWNQVLQSGTLIATVTINGTSYNVYAPSGSSSVASLDNLTDVDLNNLSNGQILQYNASTSKWENVSAGGGGYEPTGEVYTFFTEGSRASANLILYVSWTDGESAVTAEVVTFSEIASGWLTEDYRNITINWDRNTGSFNFVAKSGSFEYNGSYFDEGDTIGSLETGTVTFNAVEKEATNVSWTQVQASGTKIAEISIEGVSQNVYIPNLPTKTSDLNNDSNFVADASYVHTDNNYTSTEKTKLSGLVEVEANPSGTASTDLTKIGIGGTNYNIPSGGSGSSTFAGLSDVDIDDTTLTNGQVPVWNSTTEKWENTFVSSGPTEFIETLDVGGQWVTHTYDLTDAYMVKIECDGDSYFIAPTDIAVYSLYTTLFTKDNVNFNIARSADYQTLYVSFSVPTSLTADVYAMTRGSGGTTVIANPTGTPTDELNSIQIGNDIYEIPSGGGGTAEWTDVVGTLEAGQTQIVLTSSKIKTTSAVFPWTNKFGVAPTNMVVTNGSVALTFPVQSTDLGVMVRVTKVNTGHTYDIDLSRLQLDKSWFYYDSSKTTVADTGEGLQIAGNDNDNSWTTSGSIGINISNMIGIIPPTLSAIRLHFLTFAMSGYTGIRFINTDTLFSGTTSGSDAILRAQGFYQFENNNSSIEEEDYTLEIPCNAANFTNTYFYIMFFDGMITGNTSNYSNNLNGAYNIVIDGIDFVTGGN